MNKTQTNLEAADVFEQIALILERRGENPFKIRAYRNAVRTLEHLAEPISEIDRRGELKKIAGFGDALVGKTQEILATGTCALLERLKAEETAATEPEGPEADPQEGSQPEIESPW